MTEFYTIVTEYGLKTLKRCISNGESFPASKMAIGDANGSYYEPQRNQTTLVNQRYVNNIYAKGKKGNYLYFDFLLPPTEGDYIIREAGLFDNDGNLLAVSKYPETLKQSADAYNQKTLTIEIQLLLSDNAINTIIIDDSGNLVTEEKLEDYQKSEEKGQANGYVPLNEYAKIPIEYLPEETNIKILYEDDEDEI